MDNAYTNALHRLQRQIAPIAREYEKSVFYFWADALLAYIVYGVTPNEYIGFQFYKKNSLEKKRFYTARHSKKYEKLLNAPENYNSFWDKVKFNTIFCDYVQRKWIFCEVGGGATD